MEWTILIRVASAALVAGLATASACTQLASEFTCSTDGDCALASGEPGRCEANHRCSYADADCASGERFGELAGSASNQCTGTDGPGGSCPVAVEVRAGIADTCVRRADGSVRCWGEGSQVVTHVDLPVAPIAQLDSSGAGRCARYASGSLDCTAGPKTGDLGLAIRDLSIGVTHICAAITDGHVACWGSNVSGELGNAATAPLTTTITIPSIVVAISDARQVAAGYASTCVVTSSNGLWCWGNNTNEELGQGINVLDFATTPVAVNLGTGASTVAIGDHFACALTVGGAVACWGDNTKGESGLGTSTGTTNSPTQIPELSGIEQITAAGGHACARAGDGKVWCWGANASHESAATATAVITKPALVVDHGGAPIKFLDVDAGALHTCGRMAADGAVACWGSNANRQIGDGTTEPAVYPTPSTVGCL